MVQISPSLLAADFSRLEQEIRSVSSADLIHVDVMDGSFVPNFGIGTAETEAIRRVSPLPLDVHLMIRKPQEYVDRFTDAGAAILTFHAESDCNIAHCIEQIRSRDILPGLAIKPATPAETVFPWLDHLYMVLVMTVEPGFGGQKCKEECFEKVSAIRREANRRGLDLRIQVDGGINEENAPRVIAAGADILVAGSTVFRAADRAVAIQKLKGI